jgi:NADPH-dependent 2,4-dienoyl-CoA reductase/sulfur reductase-like enzyme
VVSTYRLVKLHLPPPDIKIFLPILLAFSKIKTERPRMSNSHVDVIVLGAGASGLMLAAHAAKRGRSVLILEKANKIGKKIPNR